jgi:hypothetical protein
VETWAEIYRGYDDAALALEIVFLQKQIRNPFLSQTEGSRSATRSTAEFRDRMAAATRVKAERANPDDNRHLVADFSEVRP